MTEKTCRNCGETKPLDAFYKHPRMLDGRLNNCSDCVRARVRRHRYTNDSVREYDRMRAMGPHGINPRPEMPNHEKNTHTKVRRALFSGVLVSQPCVFCGDTNVEAHHKDYSKPLDVVWLCPKCHRRLHALFPETVKRKSVA
jgi:ribosomal protein S27AE